MARYSKDFINQALFAYYYDAVILRKSQCVPLQSTFFSFENTYASQVRS